MLRGEGEGVAESRMFHAALVEVAGEAPVFGVGRIGAGGEALLPERPVLETTAARRERREAPQRPGETLEPAGRVAVVRAVRPELHLRAARGEMRHERRREVRGELLQVGAGAQGIGGEGRVHGAIQEPTRAAAVASVSGNS